ncbi:Pentatricopeptide repeat-containing protein [Apostasia shenzhenica]|uniref:Pentatricopeptide repeat-containing protein n=1 Tax=Apostasia shenzhenica TaxID=1088818 RepID=A0A2I0B938_9ASPA|nr:Pentatricopeptide repeat-containing protein [Apostasia shenzhenica]
MIASRPPIPLHRLVPSLRHLTTGATIVPTSHNDGKEGEEEEENEILQSVANRSYWTRKLHLLCAIPGRVDDALRLLDRLRFHGYHPDIRNLSSIVHALCAAGRFDEAHRRLLIAIASGHIPDDRTANIFLARLLDAKSPRLTLSVLSQLVQAKPAFVPSLTNYNRLIDQLCSLADPVEAHRLLLDMIARGRLPNAVTFTALIDGFGNVGRLDDALRLFEEMPKRNVLPNSLTYSVLIRWVLRKRRIGEGKDLMSRLWLQLQQGEDSSVKCAAFANLIDSLCREGLFHVVFDIAEEMPQGKWVCEKFAYAQMIDSLRKTGRNHGASRIVYIMRKRGLLPSLVSYNSIVHGLSMGRGCMRAYQLFKEGIVFGYSPTEATYKALVEGLCKERDIHKARDVAEFMLEMGVDKTRIYNIYLSALGLLDNPSEQLNVLVLMLQKQCHPDTVTLNTIIHGFCKIGRTHEAMKILDDMMQGKFSSPDVVTFTTVISGLLDVNNSEEALHLLNVVMPERHCSPNVVTYNAVLCGLFKLGKVDESMEILHKMLRRGIKADCMTHTIIIEGLLRAGCIELAQKFWDEHIWPSNIHDDYVYAAILTGLCRLGKLDVACDFLYEMVDSEVYPGIVCYNILIDCASRNGLKKQAYQIVGEMRKNGLKPDSITWRILEKLHKRKTMDLTGHEDGSIESDGNVKGGSNCIKGGEYCRR